MTQTQFQNPAYNAVYASLRAQGFPSTLLHRAATVVVSKALRTGRTASSVAAQLMGA